MALDTVKYGELLENTTLEEKSATMLHVSKQIFQDPFMGIPRFKKNYFFMENHEYQITNLGFLGINPKCD